MFFNSIKVLSGRWEGGKERISAMKSSLGKDRISHPARLEPANPEAQNLMRKALGHANASKFNFGMLLSPRLGMAYFRF